MPTDDRLTAALAPMRERFSLTNYAITTESPRILSILSASSSDVPRLLAALDAAQTLISGWEAEAARLDKMTDATENMMRSAHLSVRAQGCQDHARALREAISAALLGEEASDGS